MSKKALLFLLSGCLLMQSCATVFSESISECQSKKHARGTPRRQIRPLALAADIITCPPIALPIDFLTGAIYRPCFNNSPIFKYTDGYVIKGKSEFCISEGVASWMQLSGWAGPPRLGSYISQPSLQTGAAYITYRRFLCEDFALGISGGIDNEQGDVSYGNGKVYNVNGGQTGTSGHYELHTATVALEGLFVYKKTRKMMLYGLLGAGVAYFDDNCTFHIPGSSGPPVPDISDPYDYRTAQFNFQITPMGIRWDDKVGCFFELGFGYKGIVNGGISVRL